MSHLEVQTVHGEADFEAVHLILQASDIADRLKIDLVMEQAKSTSRTRSINAHVGWSA